MESVDLKEKLIVLRRLENELRSIRQRIDTEEVIEELWKWYDYSEKKGVASY